MKIVVRMLAIVAVMGMLVAPMLGGKALASKAAMPTAADVTIEAKDFEFAPKETTINVGDVVTFKNTGGVTHTAQAVDGSWDSGDIAAGASWTHTFTTAGTFKYYCKYHAPSDGSRGMVGTLIVAAAAAQPTATTAAAEPTATTAAAAPTATTAAPAEATATTAAPAAATATTGTTSEFATGSADTLAADDQEAESYIIVKSVHANQDGWVAVHVNTADNKPGAVIGEAAVKKGDNSNVRVELSPAPKAGDKLWPMLHIDAGTIGTYEFPGPDAPVIINNNIIMQQITLTGAMTTEPATSTTPATSTMPSTGSPLDLWMVIILGAALITAGTLVLRRRTV